MQCWRCSKLIPKGAEKCKYCERLVVRGNDVEETRESVRDTCGSLPREVSGVLCELAQTCATSEEFVNLLMVDDCPSCGSPMTGDCEEDPQIEDICVGRCFECGHLWCLDCGRVFDEVKPICSCGDEDDGSCRIRVVWP